MKSLFVLPLLIVGVSLIPSIRVIAQSYSTLYNFTTATNLSNTDGANPLGGIVLIGNRFYGTANQGGTSGKGTLFSIHTNGITFTNLHSFAAFQNGTNSDGANPSAGFAVGGGTLFGSASQGGASSAGSIFSIRTNGTSFTNLYNFAPLINGTNTGGAIPQANLILSGNMLYGAASLGGAASVGTLFRIHTNGTGFTVLHNFSPILSSAQTNSDGAYPDTGLIVAGGKLYGAAYGGGAAGSGTVFSINTNGTGFTTLHSFAPVQNNTNSNGANPNFYSGFAVADGTLYGTTYNGGNVGAGTVFSIKTNGTGFTTLHSFNPATDAANPHGGVILSSNLLYGTTYGGGISNKGTIFQIATNGTSFAILHKFNAALDGANPIAGVLLLDTNLFGVTSAGGTSGNGTVFKYSLPPPSLTIVRAATNVVVTWPIDRAAGFTLQFTTNLAPSTIWSNVSPAPTIINGKYTVTNPITGTQRFYQLRK